MVLQAYPVPDSYWAALEAAGPPLSVGLEADVVGGASGCNFGSALHLGRSDRKWLLREESIACECERSGVGLIARQPTSRSRIDQLLSPEHRDEDYGRCTRHLLEVDEVSVG